MQVKEAIDRLKEQIKRLREVATTLEVNKSAAWNILKTKESTNSATPNPPLVRFKSGKV